VSSTFAPASVATSCTTTPVMPAATFFVSLVTVTSMRCVEPFSCSWYTQRAPGFIGQ
jgi:hypothetical protein